MTPGGPVSEETLAPDVAIDYDLIQFVADIAETTRENVQEMHARVCGLIGGGMSPSAAIQLVTEELDAKGAAG